MTYLSRKDFRRLLAISVFQGKPRFSPKHLLMKIHEGEGIPFIWIGDAPYAERLCASRRVYCLPSGRIDMQDPYTFIPAMAQHCVDEIRDAQPQGPYMLGGFCYDAWIAYEVARLLREQGEEVALVALIECFTYDKVEQVVNVVYWHFGRLRSQERWQYVNDQIKPLSQLFKRNDDVEPQAMSKDDKINYVTREGVKVYPDYRSDDRVALIFGRKSPYSTFYRLAKRIPILRFGWLRRLSNYELHLLEGSHDTILQAPLIDNLIEKLQHCIDNAVLETQAYDDHRQYDRQI